MRLAALLDFLFPLRTDEQVVRALDTDTFLALVRPELVAETTPATHALLPFRAAKVRATIHEAKYHGSTEAFALLASALGEYLSDLDLMDAKHVCVLPVPLSRLRRRERGFNQTEEVARRATEHLQVDLQTDLLIRTRETASQISLPRSKRLENMRGAFGTTRAADPARTYVLVDDVVTTGATLQAAIRALRDAGAVHVLPIALAH